MQHVSKLSPVGLIAGLGACLLIGASATIGTMYAYTLGLKYGLPIALAFGAMALGGELLKPVALERAFAAGWRKPVTLAACLLVAAVAVAYSLAAELAFSAGSRGDQAAARKAAVEGAATARGNAQRASDELARLKPSRTVAEVQAAIAGARPVCSVQVSHGVRNKEVCSKPPALLAELGRAQRRAELEAALGRAQAGIAAGAGVGAADPAAAAVSTYLAAAGIVVDELGTWLHLLPVLLLEVGSLFGLLIARACQPTVATPCSVASVGAPENVFQAPVAPANVVEPLPANVVQLAGKRRLGPMARQTSVPTVGKHPVLEALDQAGRQLNVSELGKAMGVTTGEASKRWREVEAELAVRKVGKHVMVARRA